MCIHSTVLLQESVRLLDDDSQVVDTNYDVNLLITQSKEGWGRSRSDKQLFYQHSHSFLSFFCNFASLHLWCQKKINRCILVLLNSVPSDPFLSSNLFSSTMFHPFTSVIKVH